MSPTILRRIALGLGVIVALWLLLALIRSSSADRPGQLTLPRVAASEADRILYAGPKDTVRLEREPAGWRVNGHPASIPAVEEFFRALADTGARSELVARNAASHARLGVDSATGKRVSVSSAGKVLLDVWFGNRGPDFEGFYARRAGDDQVYLVHGPFANLTARTADDWRDKRMLQLAPDSVRAVVITRGREHYRLERADSGWRAGAAGVDSARVGRLVTAVAGLEASGFPDTTQAKAAVFQPAERKVILEGPAGAVLAEVELDSLTPGWVGRIGPAGEPFRVSPGVVDQIAPALASLQH